MKKGYYIILTHTYVPNKENAKKHNVIEKCEFVTRVKPKMLTNATVILDPINKQFIKNRVKHASFEQFQSHVKKTHANEYKQFVELVKKEEGIDLDIVETDDAISETETE